MPSSWAASASVPLGSGPPGSRAGTAPTGSGAFWRCAPLGLAAGRGRGGAHAVAVVLLAGPVAIAVAAVGMVEVGAELGQPSAFVQAECLCGLGRTLGQFLADWLRRGRAVHVALATQGRC